MKIKFINFLKKIIFKYHKCYKHLKSDDSDITYECTICNKKFDSRNLSDFLDLIF